MRFSARIFSRIFSFLLIAIFLLPAFSSTVSAQTINAPSQPSTTNEYIKPNVEPDVPQNQHTFMQSLFLEMLIAIQCQLTGIDITSPTGSCLGVNLDTGKLGYAPASQNGAPPIGGILGMLNSSISSMYVPAFGSGDYFRYLADSFGIAKTTYAAPATGFQGLSPILGLWKASRDIAYFLLIIAFIFIGIGVMLRLHIDPRTVMTIQNQIPRVIICIILITFSYAFAGLLIDAMWTVTYMGVNRITEAGSNPNILDCRGSKKTLGEFATDRILQTPFSFVNGIFIDPGCGIHSGVLNLSFNVGRSISAIELDLLADMMGAKDGCKIDAGGAGIGAAIGTVIFPVVGTVLGGIIGAGENAATCAMFLGTSVIMRHFLYLMWFIVVTIIIIITLFRIWFELIKAFAMVLLYVILGPLWIVFGLLPKKPLGFEKWLRVYFAELAVFPAVVFMLVGARVLGDLFDKNPEAVFIPPLIGNPNIEHLGTIIEFAMLLMAPTLLSLIREKLGVQASKQFATAMQTFNAGRTMPGAATKKVVAGAMRRNPTTGQAEGAIPVALDRLKGSVKRGLFSREGIFGTQDREGFVRRGLREDAERATNLSEIGQRITHSQRYGDRIQDAVSTPAQSRSASQRALLNRFDYLLSPEQRGELGSQFMLLPVRAPGATPGTTQVVQFAMGGNQSARNFVISQANALNRDALERDWDRDHRDMSNVSTHGLTDNQIARIQRFLESQATNRRVNLPPPPPTGGPRATT